MNLTALTAMGLVCLGVVLALALTAVWYYMRWLNSAVLGWSIQSRILPVQARQLPHFPQWAAQRGFRYAPRDDRWVSLAHQLQLSGIEPWTEHVFHGEVRGLEAAAFQFSHMLPKDQQRGPFGDKRRARYTITAVRLPATAPGLMISPAGALDQLPSKLGLAPVGIQFEQHHFNERFTVRSDQERFASAVLDPMLMEWMMTLPALTQEHLVIHGNWLFILAREPIVLDRLDERFGMLGGFADRVPDHVWGTHWSVMGPR